MPLRVDAAAERTLAQIIGGLRSARLDAGRSQNKLAVGLPVRGRAISEWETGAVEPSMAHLIQWSHALGLRLVIVGLDGGLRPGPALQQAGETWEKFARRRLAVPLRNRRLALGLTLPELGERVGVSRDSIHRWEFVYTPPQPIALVVWAQNLAYSVALQPIATGPMAERLHRIGVSIPP